MLGEMKYNFTIGYMSGVTRMLLGVLEKTIQKREGAEGIGDPQADSNPIRAVK